MTICILFSVCQIVGWGPQPYKIILITTAQEWLCFLQYPAQLSLTWSGGVNLPNNGVSLYLQNWVDLNYYIRFAVLWLASVLNSCLENIGVLIFLFLGLRMGPQSFQNCTQPCTTASTLRLT